MSFQSTTACFLTFILPLHSWDYIFSDTEEGPFFWSEEYEHCGGDTQSPINIDDDTVLDGFSQFSSKLSSFNISKYDGGIFNNTFLNHWDWNGEFLHHFYVLNNDHSISLTPVNSEGNKLNTKENGHIATLSNIFSEYNNNISYCLNEFHFHWGEYNTDGSEHTINGIQYPFEVHFVHYRCDFDNISHALKSYDSENDEYVLAVVAFLFEVNESATTDETNVLTEIIEDIESLHQDDDFTYIANINLLGSILPYDMEYISNNDYDLINRETSNMYYYQGSLTTPTCDEVVRWHIFNNHKPKITSDILSYFRNLNGTHGILSHNWRPVQDNINPVYSFTFGDSDNGNSESSGSGSSGNSNSGSSGGDNESSTVEAMPFVLLGILILVLLCVLICIYYQNKNRPQQSEEEEFANVIKMSESPPAGNDTAKDGYNNDHNTNNYGNTNNNNNNNHYYNAIGSATTFGNNYNDNGNNIDNNRYNASIEIFDRNENNKRLITHINNNNNNNDNDNDNNNNGNNNRYDSPSVGDEMVETEMKQNTFSSAVIAGEVNSSSNGNGHAPASHHDQHSNGIRNDSVTGTVTAPRQSTSKDNTIANNNNNNSNNNNNNKTLGGAVNNMTRQATDEIAENEIDDALKLFDDGEDTVDQTKKRYAE